MPINKIRITETTGQNLYAFIWDADGKICYPTGQTFETYGTNSRDATNYAITLTEKAVGYYLGSWPSFIERGNYDVVVRLRTGATPADNDYNISAPAESYWTGAAISEDPETNAVNLCNMALLKIGGGKDDSYPISDLSGDERSTSYNCNMIYTPARKEVLKRMKPQEVTYYAECDESSFTGEKGQWQYVFDLPSNCLMVTKMIDQSDHSVKYEYEIKQGYLFANSYSNSGGDKAYIEYIKNETDANTFEAETVDALVTKIAAGLAPMEVGGELGWQISRNLTQEYETLILPKSKGINQSMQYDNQTADTNIYSWLGGRS
jgi:hypothetical protein